MITLTLLIGAAVGYLALKLTGNADPNGFTLSFRLGGGGR